MFLDMFTSEQQEEFFLHKLEEDESSLVNSGFHFEHLQGRDNIENKQNIKIDGINYQFKHIIRN